MDKQLGSGLKLVLFIIVFWCLLLLAINPATAAPIAKATSPVANPDGSRDSITLHDEQGSICPDNSRRAVYYIGKTKETVEGCYVIRDKQVHMGFVDGDQGVLSVDMFVPVVGKAPQVSPQIGIQGVGPGKDTKGTPRPLVPQVAPRGPYNGPLGYM